LRLPLYAGLADHTIDTHPDDVATCVDRIVHLVA
jgi:hypothetical protein